MSEDLLVGWMQFKHARPELRAHVFRPTPGDPRLMDSLCGRWRVRPYSHSLCGRWRVRPYSQVSGIAILEAAADDRPRCKICEKRLKEINNG